MAGYGHTALPDGATVTSASATPTRPPSVAVSVTPPRNDQSSSAPRATAPRANRPAGPILVTPQRTPQACAEKLSGLKSLSPASEAKALPPESEVKALPAHGEVKALPPESEVETKQPDRGSNPLPPKHGTRFLSLDSAPKPVPPPKSELKFIPPDSKFRSAPRESSFKQLPPELVEQIVRKIPAKQRATVVSLDQQLIQHGDLRFSSLYTRQMQKVETFEALSVAFQRIAMLPKKDRSEPLVAACELLRKLEPKRYEQKVKATAYILRAASELSPEHAVPVLDELTPALKGMSKTNIFAFIEKYLTVFQKIPSQQRSKSIEGLIEAIPQLWLERWRNDIFALVTAIAELPIEQQGPLFGQLFFRLTLLNDAELHKSVWKGFLDTMDAAPTHKRGVLVGGLIDHLRLMTPEWAADTALKVISTIKSLPLERRKGLLEYISQNLRDMSGPSKAKVYRKLFIGSEGLPEKERQRFLRDITETLLPPSSSTSLTAEAFMAIELTKTLPLESRNEILARIAESRLAREPDDKTDLYLKLIDGRLELPIDFRGNA